MDSLDFISEEIEDCKRVILENKRGIHQARIINSELEDTISNLECVFNIHVFELMNKTSYRKFMKYMSKNHGW